MTKSVDWNTFEKFQIYNIFWNNNAISNTTKNRNYLWDELINLRAKLISRSEVSRKNLKLKYFRELKDKLGPKLALLFVDLAIYNKNDNFILDFQKENMLKNVNSLFKIFNILHYSQFPLSNFNQDAIQLIKNYKWRINNKKTVLKAFKNYCNPILMKISDSDINSIEEKFSSNFNSNNEVMFRPVVETNHLNNLMIKMAKPQVNILEELEKFAKESKK
jgi:hypothetical protein